MSEHSEFQKLQSKLRPLNLYLLSGTTLVDAELKAYAAGIDILNEKLEVLEREAFIATATTYGITERERITGGIKTGIDINNRRDMLIYRFSITVNDFSKANIEKALRACGLDTTIIEKLDGATIHIDCKGLLDHFDTEQDAIEAAQSFLPAHLSAHFDFRILTWDYIDANDKTFSEMDSANFTWDQIDNYRKIL